MKNKGEYMGRCNLTACTTGNPATWYNHGSYSHYCEGCAKRLNEDPVNTIDAMRMFGHTLCTPVKSEQTESTKSRSEFLESEYTKEMVYEYTRLPEADFYEPMTKKQSLQHCVPVRNSAIDPKIQNNDTCPCGSGKKYKKCCRQSA